MKHTPGPWIAEPNHKYQFQIFAKNGAVHAFVQDTDSERLQANVSLISAAPELLEALQKVVAISDRKHDAWDEAKAAIAKAEGRNHVNS